LMLSVGLERRLKQHRSGTQKEREPNGPRRDAEG
jgi:hypothetical protein